MPSASGAPAPAPQDRAGAAVSEADRRVIAEIEAASRAHGWQLLVGSAGNEVSCLFSQVVEVTMRAAGVPASARPPPPRWCSPCRRVRCRRLWGGL